MDYALDQVIALVTAGRPENLLWVVVGLTFTLFFIYSVGGRFWAFVYFLMIPFLNWSFGVIDSIEIIRPNSDFPRGVELHPLTLVTGLVFVFRDFVQRRLGQWVLAVMALAIAWSFYYAWPVIALASGVAFAVSEIADWVLFTFTRYRLSTRILLSSAAAAPIDTTIFLYGADLAVRLNREAQRAAAMANDPDCQVNSACEALVALPPLEPGTMLHAANWTVFAVGKMVGAVIVAGAVRRRERRSPTAPEHAAV